MLRDAPSSKHTGRVRKRDCVHRSCALRLRLRARALPDSRRSLLFEPNGIERPDSMLADFFENQDWRSVLNTLERPGACARVQSLMLCITQEWLDRRRRTYR
jgi:hypothetical protein